MFKGFDVKLPEYEILTPHTKMSFTLRTLTVQEEERLKGSFLTPAKILNHLNKCIYETIVVKPDKIKDMDSFLKYLTVKDRDALLFGLYHVTYEEVRNYDVKCTSCSHPHSVSINASETFNMDSYPGKGDILSKQIAVKLPKLKNVTAYVKQPSLKDESDAINQLSSRPGTTNDSIAETLIIDRFEQDMEESKTPKRYKERIDVLDAYISLPPLDKREIHKVYRENFGKYGVDLKMKVACPSCGYDEVINIDLVESFFRNIYSI